MHIHMGEWVTVSTKVRRETLEKARRLNINVSEVLRRALEEEIREREEEEARRLLELASKELGKIPPWEVVEELRKWRRER
jgi:antitoxin CcdA